jgi:hypothetical protein
VKPRNEVVEEAEEEGAKPTTTVVESTDKPTTIGKIKKTRVR